MITPHRFAPRLAFCVLATTVGVFGCSKEASPSPAASPSSSSSASAPKAAPAAGGFLAAGFAGTMDVEVEDAAGERVFKLNGDGASVRLKGPNGVGHVEGKAGKHGKVSYTAADGVVFEVRGEEANEFKVKSAAGATLLKVKRDGEKIKVKAGEAGVEVVVFKGNAEKMKLVLPPSDAAIASVKKSESGKFKVKAADESTLFKIRSPVASAAHLVPALKGTAVALEPALQEVLMCELLRRGW